MAAAERIRVFRIAGLTGRLDRDVGEFGERQELGLEAIGRRAAAPGGTAMWSTISLSPG